MNGMLSTLDQLANTVGKLRNIPSTPELYQKIFEISKEIFGFEVCSVLLGEPNSKTLRVAAAAGEGADALRDRLTVGHGALGRAMKTGDVQLARDTIGDADAAPGRDDILSEVMIPLRDRESVIGVLKLESRTRRFDDDFLPLFTVFGEQVTGAINELRLRAMLDERSKTLAAISRANQLLTARDTEDDVLKTILEHVMKALKPDGCTLQLFDNDRAVLFVERGLGNCADYVGTRIPLDRSIPGVAATTRRPSLVPDASKSDKKISVLPDYLSEIAVPILFGGDALGVLHLVHCRANMFDETDLLSAAIFADQLGFAIRIQRGDIDRRDRASINALLEGASAHLTEKGDFGEQLERMLSIARDVLGVQHTSVLVPEPADPYLRIFLAHGIPEGTGDLRIPINESITGEVYRTAAPLLVSDVTQEPRYIAGMSGAVSEIAVPLKAEGEVIGVLNLESSNRLSSSHRDMATLFAVQVAMALDKAEMGSRLRTWRRRLDFLGTSAAALNEPKTLEAQFETLLDSALEALQLECCALLLVDEEEGDLVVTAEKGFGDTCGMRIALGEGITGAVAERGKPILVEDILLDERYVDSGVKGRCEMAVPLVVHGEVIGVLDTEGAEPGMFGTDELDLFSAFAAHAAVAVHLARLFKHMEEANNRFEENIAEMVRMNTELSNYSKKVFRINESLEFQLKNLTAVHEAGKTITSSLDLDHTLHTILDMTSQIIGSTAGAIKLIDEETHEFQTRAESGSLTDVSAASSVFEVPLKIGEKKIGVFELVLKAENGVGKNEQRMVETLASQAAIAIENARLFESTQQIYYDTLRSLARALEARDDYTRGHSERVADLAKQISEHMGLDDETVQTIYNASLLHDIGKIGIRDKVLLAPRKLTDEEMDIIQEHSAFGNAILMPLKFLSNIREVVRHHHERWDGTGYPDGRKREEIPLPSRIIAVADAYDAMTSNRPYRASISHQVAVENIRELSGTQFDPHVVAAFLSVVES